MEKLWCLYGETTVSLRRNCSVPPWKLSFPTVETVIFPVYKKKIPENRGLFHNFRFSLGYDNLQQAGISEDVGSLTVFLYTAGKGASCPYCGHFSH